MSYNRLQYDKCAYATEVQESVSVLDYNIFKLKYVNKQCDNTETPNEISFVDRTLAENELTGLNRRNSLCPTKKFNPHVNFETPEYSPNRICESIHYMTPSKIEKPKTNMLPAPNLNKK